VAETPRRYTFPPLERRGLLLGLHGGQVGTLLGGLAAALLAGQIAPGPAGPVLAILVLAVAAGAALWPWAGRPLASWASVAGAWAARRGQGPSLESVPAAGRADGG
jgi:hypothetical protein